MRTVKKLKSLAVAAMIAAGLGCTADAVAAKNVMCLKTNTGQYIEVVRVSMMVVPDGGNTFEIVVKDGDGATGVESISFEKHASDIDLSKYNVKTDGESSIDMTKPIFMLTSTGKYFYMKELPIMLAKDGQSKFDVQIGGTTESDVNFVYFFRGPKEEAAELATGIETPKTVAAEESLTLQSPISSQMTISGCGAATKATIYSLNGHVMAETAVDNGVTTVQVGNFTPGFYIVKVGNKSLKFFKK